MATTEKPHGRSLYNAGCRCGVCRAANRDHSRRRRSKHHLQPVSAPPAEASPPAEFISGPVTEAVAAQLADTAAAQERPGLYAIAIRLAQLLDNPDAVPQYASAAHRLTEVLTTLSKSSTRRGKLRAVRGMTDNSPPR